MKTKSQLQREIREAKRKLDNATHGTPEKQLGKLELEELAR